jgi:hypothetical protein
LTSTESTSSSGGDETDLLTVRSVTANGRGVTDVLMVTTTMRMFYRIHSNTTNSGPGVTLSLVLVVSTASLQHGLLHTTTTGNETDHSTAVRADSLLLVGGQLNEGLVVIRVVGNNGGESARSTGHSSTVTSLLFNVANDGTFGEVANRDDVTDAQLSLSANIDELTSVKAFGGNESLSIDLELVGVSELNLSKGSTTARVVNDFLDETLQVTVSLGKIVDSVSSRSLSVFVVALEDGTSTLSLRSNNTTHVD